MKTRRREYRTRPVSVFSSCIFTSKGRLESISFHFVLQARLITQQRVDNDGILSFQPHVKLVRLQSPTTPPKRKNAGRSRVRKILIDANENVTASKLVRIRTPKLGPKRPGTPKSRGHARVDRRTSDGPSPRRLRANAVQPNLERPIPRQPPRDRSSPPLVDPRKNRKSKKLVNRICIRCQLVCVDESLFFSSF